MSGIQIELNGLKQFYWMITIAFSQFKNLGKLTYSEWGDDYCEFEHTSKGTVYRIDGVDYSEENWGEAVPVYVCEKHFQLFVMVIGRVPKKAF